MNKKLSKGQCKSIKCIKRVFLRAIEHIDIYIYIESDEKVDRSHRFVVLSCYCNYVIHLCLLMCVPKGSTVFMHTHI